MMHLCQDAGQNKPGCLTVADPACVMDFTDIGEGYIHWCSACGPQSHAISKVLDEALQTQPGFAEKFREAIEKETGVQLEG